MPGELSAAKGVAMQHKAEAERARHPRLKLLDPLASHHFCQPAKKINEGEDVSYFLTSRAYRDLLAWLLQLNASMFPRTLPDGHVQTWELDSTAVILTQGVQRIQTLITHLQAAIDEAPPDTGPRRFGNISFRKWFALVEERADTLLNTCLEDSDSPLLAGDARKELRAYLLGSLGSAQRLDYGTGHELSFLAFLGGLWKLGYFGDSTDGSEERSIVLHAVEPYLELVRRLILTYNLEPAGSHGVWGLDDHAFVPYILGSAQFAPAIRPSADIPQEGSLPGAPDPGEVAVASAVERERSRNMYFAAIGFIYDVKKGPFHEHSPTLYDISGVKAGWAKINKGMIKMYVAEVLSKYPVVQHFPFGQLYEWERDLLAPAPAASAHVQAQPANRAPSASASTAAPWTEPAAGGISGSGVPLRGRSALPHRGPASPADKAANQLPGTVVTRAAGGSQVPVTKAPWAK